jgi:tetratricopeptide (TPR) repeat protein
MIVKNEAHVILRCLESVRPLVDYVVIEDTGSTDGTQQIVTDWLWRENLPGVVIEEPWRDFAYNRSDVLAKLREAKDIDYAFIIDADDVLIFDPDVRIDELKRGLVAECYTVDIVSGAVIYQRLQLCKNNKPFYFRGVVHEYLDCQDGIPTIGHVNGLYIRYNHDGARSLDAETDMRDTQLMESAILTEPDRLIRARYAFHLAQNYGARNDLQKALHYYLLRADMGWETDRDLEEVYVCLVQAARIKEALRFDCDDIAGTYKRAIELDVVPRRAEAIHGISRLFRIVGRNSDGYEMAKTGLDLPMPKWLFFGKWIYEYGLLDEFAINSCRIGKYEESLAAGIRILETNKIPPHERPRIVANARLALGRLGDRSAGEIAVYEDQLARFGSTADTPPRELVADALFSRGVELGTLGRGEEAIAAYDDLLACTGAATDPSLRELVAKTLFNKGSVLGGLGRNEEAVAAYGELLTWVETAPELPLRVMGASSLINKGVRLGELGCSGDEIAAYDDLLARFGAATELPLRDLVARALFNKGVALGRLGRNEDAIAAYDDLLTRVGAATELPLRVRAAKALINKGVRLSVLNRYEDAIATFDDLLTRFGAAPELQLSELTTDALANKAEAFGLLGRNENCDPGPS